jgi:LacI family transcriptional regulator
MKLITFVSPATYSYAIRVIDGIVHYVAQTPDLYFQTLENRGFMPMQSDVPKIDGAIGIFRTEEEVMEYEQRGIPVINIGKSLVRTHRQVFADDFLIGSLAASSLLLAGYRRFLFVTSEFYSLPTIRTLPTPDRLHQGVIQGRLDGFREELKKSNLDCEVVILKNVLKSSEVWLQEKQRLGSEIGKSADTTGVFCATDTFGHLAITACETAGISIPGQAGVLGVNNDKILCHATKPALSSIDQGEERLGYAAAQLLHRIFEGKEPQDSLILIPPIGVEERESLPYLSSDQPVLQSAIAYLRQHMDGPFKVDELATGIRMPRRQLERLFQKRLGSSPAKVMVQLRMERARRMLVANPGVSVKEVAGKCGYTDLAAFHRAFRRFHKETPTACKKQSGNPLG